MAALKKLLILLTVVLSGCAATISQLKYDNLLKTKGELEQQVIELRQEIQPTPEEIAYIEVINEEAPRFEKFLETWSENFAFFLSIAMEDKVQIHVEEFVFLDDFSVTAARSWFRNSDTLRKAISLFAKNNEGEWKYVDTFWTESFPLNFTPAPSPEDNFDEKL